MTSRSQPSVHAGDISRALASTLISPNESDSNGESANVVDGLFAIARAIHHLAGAVEGAGTPALTDEQAARAPSAQR